MRIEEPKPAAAPGGLALFALGFRPFYLLAALFSALAVLGWTAMLEGRIGSAGALHGVHWHQHEMVFGFALAVIAGFLLTAGRVWTGLPTPTGVPLALLALVWLAARVLLVTGPAVPGAIVDGAFPFVLAAVMARVILGSKNARNYFVVALLAALGAANVVFHLAVAGALDVAPHAPIKFSLYLVLALVAVMAGRVVPAFTGNALPKARIVQRPTIDRISIAATLAALGADALELGPRLVAPAAFAAAILHVLKQSGWSPLATLRRPILWSLHAGQAWFPIGFVLLALASLGVVAPAVPLHAFGLGAMGGMIIAMITRTALGHTARPLAAGGAETACYILVHAAAAVRVLAGIAPGFGYAQLVAASGFLWAAAFLVYFAVYLPRLARPRLDGRPG